MSLQVTQLIGFGVGGPAPPSYSFRALTAWTAGAGQTSHTFTGADIGAAAGDRVVAVTVGGVCSSVPGTLSMTIAGNSATQAVFRGSSDTVTFAALFYLAVPSGSTADIALSSTYGTYGYTIAVYAMYGLASGTPGSSTSSQASPSSLNLNTSVNSVVLGFQVNQNNTFSWSRLTADASAVNMGATGYYGSPASAQAVSAETPRTISCTLSSASRYVGVAGVWT